MMEQLFEGIFDTGTTRVITITDFLLCIIVSLLVGLIIMAAYAFRSRYTKSFLNTLALLPAVVCVVIMMVNGNVGTGVAVAGAFGLVRFRSVPGTAREIGALFLAMCAGLITGMGYLAYAVLFSLLLSGAAIVYTILGERFERITSYKTLRITIPEDLDYEGMFDDIFEEYTNKCELRGVKTANMGSLFRLTYNVEMKKKGTEKAMLDLLRQRNGNLEITVSPQGTETMEL